MKKILVLIVAPFAFLLALPAQITWKKADEIVLERAHKETQPYTVYAKENVLADSIPFTTSAGETLELNYSCWIYYIRYNHWPDKNAAPGRYLIVNESNGNLLEINAKNDDGPDDLVEWRIVTNVLENCDQDVIISAGEYEKLSDVPFLIQDMKITGNCLKIRISASGCDGSSWVVKLVDAGIVAESNPPQRALRLSFENNEACLTVISREFSFNIEDLQIQETNKVSLNVSGKLILYEYKTTVVDCTNEPTTSGNVLMLKVDYLTNTFEGGYEFTFDSVPNCFTIRREYKSPGDFGYVKFFYYETGDMLFHGSIFWMGEGQIHFPENLLPVSAFDAVDTADFVTPKNGFENIMAEYQPYHIDYEHTWGGIQNLVKVREYLKANPEQKGKIFLYTPCVGVGDPEHWDWILFLKK